MLHLAPVAQMDRVPDYESVGRGFESLRARQPHQDACLNSVETGFIFC